MIWTLVISLVLITLFAALLMVLRARGAANAAAKPSEPCWVCGHGGLEEVARQVYQCSACGNVQGSQAIAYRNAQRRAAYVSLAFGDAGGSAARDEGAQATGESAEAS